MEERTLHRHLKRNCAAKFIKYNLLKNKESDPIKHTDITFTLAEDLFQLRVMLLQQLPK